MKAPQRLVKYPYFAFFFCLFLVLSQVRPATMSTEDIDKDLVRLTIIHGSNLYQRKVLFIACRLGKSASSQEEKEKEGSY